MTNTDSATGRALPLVAVGYGPRCVPVMQLAEAAAGVCDLLWMIDTSVPGMGEMTDLLNRFGAVVDLEGASVEQAVKVLGDWEPDGLTTFLDAGMVELACVAEGLGLPFHSPATAAALTDKARQRQALADAGLDMPPCRLVRPDHSRRDSRRSTPRWVGPPSSSPARPRAAATPSWSATAPNSSDCSTPSARIAPRWCSRVIFPTIRPGPATPTAAMCRSRAWWPTASISHLALTGRFPPAKDFRETGFFIPAALDAESRSAVLDLATRAIAALGVRTGCLHTEVKFTPDGPRIIEVNGRLGGGVPEMLERAAGVSLLDLTLRVALGEPVSVDEPGGHQPHRLPLLPPAADRLGHGDGHRGHQRLQRPRRGGHGERPPGARAPPSTGATAPATTSWPWSARPTTRSSCRRPTGSSTKRSPSPTPT